MATNETPEQPANAQPSGGQPAGGLFGVPTKWLIIGGGGGGGVLLVVIVVVVLFLSGVIGGGNPQPTSVLDLVPDDASLVRRMDVQRIWDNDVLSDVFGLELLEDFEGGLGINSGDLSEFVIAEWGSSEIAVIKGNFDLDFMRDELEDNDAEENSYRGYEVWERDGGAGALFDEYLVVSDNAVRPVENVLKNLYNGSGSLERADEDNEMKQILDNLGSGFIVYAATGDSCQVERCEGYGWVIGSVSV